MLFPKIKVSSKSEKIFSVCVDIEKFEGQKVEKFKVMYIFLCDCVSGNVFQVSM